MRWQERMFLTLEDACAMQTETKPTDVRTPNTEADGKEMARKDCKLLSNNF